MLAAGNSSRMGFPKQLLKWKNTTLLQHAINTVKEEDLEHIVLVLGANSKKIESNIDTNRTMVLINENWGKGLGNSIAFGVKHIMKSLPNIESVLIMLADQPLIDSNYLNRMLETHYLNPSNIICTFYQNNKNGVPAIFTKKQFQDLSLLNGDQGAKVLLEKYSKNVLSLNGKGIVADIDTLEGYEALYKKHH